jgi:hypothetical protein
MRLPKPDSKRLERDTKAQGGPPLYRNTAAFNADGHTLYPGLHLFHRMISNLIVNPVCVESHVSLDYLIAKFIMILHKGYTWDNPHFYEHKNFQQLLRGQTQTLKALSPTTTLGRIAGRESERPKPFRLHIVFDRSCQIVFNNIDFFTRSLKDPKFSGVFRNVWTEFQKEGTSVKHWAVLLKGKKVIILESVWY